MSRYFADTAQEAEDFHRGELAASSLTEQKSRRASNALRDAMFKEAQTRSERFAVANQISNTSQPLDLDRPMPVRRAPMRRSLGGRIRMPIDPALPCPRCGANPRYGCEHMEPVAGASN